LSGVADARNGKTKRDDEDAAQQVLSPQEANERHIKQTMGANFQELGPRFTFDTQFGEP
jgi:hypothetical protein